MPSSHARRLLAATLLPLALAACSHVPPPPIVAHDSVPATLHAPVVLADIGADGELRTQLLNGSAGSTEEAFRIASVTKTFVAATVLRLAEQGEVDLAASIAGYIDPALDRILREEGHATDSITVRQVLSHTAGLNDHAQSPNFIAVWQNDPRTHWQRRDHIEKLAEWTEPVGAPGEKFAYSDSGYLLLGDLIERITGKRLSAAVREQLDFDALGLDDTWWEQDERALAPRAHQVMGGVDTHDWDATFDLYGGGGLVATTQDMARFFHALFSGRVFDQPATLALMLSAEGLPAASPYRLGIFEAEIDGRPVYWHAGFWGTYVAHDPATGRTFAASACDQRDYRALLAMSRAYFSGATAD